jgi:hypothetical protein
MKKDVLFLKKKNEKDFCSASRLCATVSAPRKKSKFFCFFLFTKRSTFFFFQATKPPRLTDKNQLSAKNGA